MTDFGAYLVYDNDAAANAGKFGKWSNKKQLKYLKDTYKLTKDDILFGDYVQFSTHRANDLYIVDKNKRFIKNPDWAKNGSLTIPCSITKHMKNPFEVYSRVPHDDRPMYLCLSSKDAFVKAQLGHVNANAKILWNFSDKTFIVEDPKTNEYEIRKQTNTTRKNKTCLKNKIVNTLTNRCWKPCPTNFFKNPKTYKCVKNMRR